LIFNLMTTRASSEYLMRCVLQWAVDERRRIAASIGPSTNVDGVLSSPR
jgi:hypothetical protein